MSVEHPLAARTTIDTSHIEPYVSVARSSYSLAPAVKEPVSSRIPILDFDPSIGVTRYTEAILLVIDNMMWCQLRASWSTTLPSSCLLSASHSSMITSSAPGPFGRVSAATLQKFCGSVR